VNLLQLARWWQRWLVVATGQEGKEIADVRAYRI
jgi:hypothetical protein